MQALNSAANDDIMCGYDRYGGRPISDEHTLEFLLAFNGRVHHLEKGYWLKFEFGRMSRRRSARMG